MRNYMALDNLMRAAALAAILVPMSIGRLLAGGWPLATGIAMAFISATLICAAVTAWGRSAGMAGVWTDAPRLRHGLLAALALGLALWPVFLLGVDAPTREALGEATREDALRLAFPPTPGGRVALILWSAGFQTVFMQAAPMSFAGRLTGSRFASLVFCLLFRIYVSHRQMASAGLVDHMALWVAPSAAVNLVGCLLFARFGLAPAMLFSAVLYARLLLLP